VVKSISQNMMRHVASGTISPLQEHMNVMIVEQHCPTMPNSSMAAAAAAPASFKVKQHVNRCQLVQDAGFPPARIKHVFSATAISNSTLRTQANFASSVS